jgi:predicted nucleic acid-binding protein
VKPADVPPGPLALDTDVFSMLHIGKGRFADFQPLVAGHPLALPFPVVGELKVLPIRTRGAYWGPRRTAMLEQHIARCVVIPSTAAVVDMWAQLAARFLGRLKDGGVNDMWIAACCLVHDLPLATGNLSDFQTIAAEFPDLALVHPDL